MFRTTKRCCFRPKAAGSQFIDLKGSEALEFFYPRGLILNFVTPAPNPLAFWLPARVQVVGLSMS